MHFILSSSKYVIKMRYCQRIYWLLGKRLVIRQKIWYHTRVKSKGESGVSRHSPDPPATRVDPPGAHPTVRSILGGPGEVSLHLMPCHFPSIAWRRCVT